MFYLKVNPIDSSDLIDNPGLNLIYVGETVKLCLIVQDEHKDALDVFEDTLQVTLERFVVTECRRLFSDSTTEINRMRSVDSLISDEFLSSSLQPTQITRSSSWNVSRQISPSSNCLVFTHLFTPQPMSDDSCNVNCKFVVKVKQVKKIVSENRLKFDAFVEGYLESALGLYSDNLEVCLTNVETLEHSITLSNPLRINHQLCPSTSAKCCLNLQLESLCVDDDDDDDGGSGQLSIKKVDLAIIPAKSAIQTGHRCNEWFTFTQLTQLPVCVGAFEEAVEFLIDRHNTLPLDLQYKVKADLVVEIEGRMCLLSYESPFDPLKAFLPLHSDDFTVSFTSSKETVKLGDTFDVHIRIDNKTNHRHDLLLLFPLLPDHGPSFPSPREDLENLSTEEVTRILQARLLQFPCFVCLEAERPIGVIREHSIFECNVKFLAVQPGRHFIHKVQLVEREGGVRKKRVVDFLNVLQLTVSRDEQGLFMAKV